VTIKRAEFDHMVQKLGLRTRQSGDLLAWFEHEGRVVARTRRSLKKGDLPMQHSIRQQLHLDEAELRRVVGCKLSRDDYIRILRDKGRL